MTNIDIFYQVEGVAEVQHVSAAPDEQLGTLKTRLAAKHGIDGDVVLFLEDADDVANETAIVSAIATSAGTKVHLHRCRHIAVTVAFADRLLKHEFRPGATVARVKHWAAHQLGMSKEDAGEHVLQIAGTKDRPTPSTHIGTLAKCPACHVAFDLVPDERVNGAWAA